MTNLVDVTSMREQNLTNVKTKMKKTILRISVYMTKIEKHKYSFKVLDTNYVSQNVYFTIT